MGRSKWKYKTGEIIDSAAALGRLDPQTGDTVTFISGDGFMYHFRSGDFSSVEERLVWKFEAQPRPGVSFNRWFEGNVAIGPDGTLYAGNTNFNYYAIHPDGSLKWTYSTGSNNWSQAAFGDDGTLYWGSVDTFIRAVSPAGKERWRRRTLGFIAASAALGSDGTVYIGSFDSQLYALDPDTGRVKWKFSTQDHIYSSAALGADAAGNHHRHLLRLSRRQPVRPPPGWQAALEIRYRRPHPLVASRWPDDRWAGDRLFRMRQWQAVCPECRRWQPALGL